MTDRDVFFAVIIPHLSSSPFGCVAWRTTTAHLLVVTNCAASLNAVVFGLTTANDVSVGAEMCARRAENATNEQ